jgi:hypothetical protein
VLSWCFFRFRSHSIKNNQWPSVTEKLTSPKTFSHWPHYIPRPVNYNMIAVLPIRSVGKVMPGFCNYSQHLHSEELSRSSTPNARRLRSYAFFDATETPQQLQAGWEHSVSFASGTVVYFALRIGHVQFIWPVQNSNGICCVQWSFRLDLRFKSKALRDARCRSSSFGG